MTDTGSPSIERVRAAKREFENKLKTADGDDFDATTIAGVKYRVAGLDLADNDAIEVREGVVTLVESLDTVDAADSEWAPVRNALLDARGVVDPTSPPFSTSEQAATLARVWNGLIGLQHHIEDQL